MRANYFGLQDASGYAQQNGVPYGSLRLWDAGVSWRDVEKSQGVYDFTRLDALVAAANAKGIEVMLVVGGYTPAVYGAQNAVPPVAAFTAYCQAVLARYKGKIGYYSAWNEANPGGYFWSGTNAQLVPILKALWDTRNAVDPAAQIVGPSWASRLKFEQDDLTNLMSLGAWNYFTINGLSLYPLVGQGPEDAMDLVVTLRNALTAGGCPSSYPFWITEINYDVGGSTPPTLLPDYDQMSMLMRTYLLARTGPSNVDRVHWYRWDWGLDANGKPLANTYLTDPANKAVNSPAGNAFARVVAWMEGSTFGRVNQSNGVIHLIVHGTGQDRHIYWQPSGAATSVTFPAGTVVASSDVAGAALPGLSDRTISVTDRPKMVALKV